MTAPPSYMTDAKQRKRFAEIAEASCCEDADAIARYVLGEIEYLLCADMVGREIRKMREGASTIANVERAQRVKNAALKQMLREAQGIGLK